MPPKAGATSTSTTTTTTTAKPKAKPKVSAGSTNASTSSSAPAKKQAASSSGAGSASKTAANGTAKPKVTKSNAAVSTSGGAVAGPSNSASNLKLSPLEVQIHNAVLDHPERMMAQSDILSLDGLPDDKEAVGTAINSLMRKALFSAAKDNKGETHFKAVTKEEAKQFSHLDPEERLVIEYITGTGNQGMWTRTLKARSGLHQNVIQRAIKTLEQKKLIKNVKSVKNPTRKIYMLYNITPSIDVTGGPWYNGNELDSELIAGLQRLAKKFIREKSLPGGRVDMLYPLAFTPYLPTAHDVLAYMNSNKVLQVDLNVEHIEALLDVLVYDNDIEKVWMRRYDADGHDDNAPPASDQINGVDSSKKRKRAGENGTQQKKKKRRRSMSTASDNIDAESDGGGPEVKEEEDDDDGHSTDSDTLRNQMEPDEDYNLPPPLAGGKSNDREKPHKRPGPAGNDYYWVYRTNLAAVPTSTITNDEGERVENFNYVYDTGLYQTPCGICPVSDLCYNRGQPKVLPLPGEKDILDLNGSAGAGYNATSADWRSQVKVKGKFTKAKDRDEAKLKELLKMKVPAGSGEQENADGSWQGGGKVGGKVVAPVSPATCLYYSQWFGEDIQW